MINGRIIWTSPKGYAFVRLSDGRDAFVPSHLMALMGRPHVDREVMVTVSQSNNHLICQALSPKS